MSTYAVIETGGKQYRVQPGDIIQVEMLDGDVGTAMKFDRVLFMSKGDQENAQVWLGKHYLNGATVQAEVVAQGRGDKILIIKMKRRKQYRRTQGHRQPLTELLVTAVDNGSGENSLLDDSAKKDRLNKFHTQLKEKGQPFTPKTLGSRKRLAAAKAAGKTTEAASPAASTKTAAPKTAKTKTVGAKKSTGTKTKKSAE